MKIDDLNIINSINSRPAETTSGRENPNVQTDSVKAPQQDRVELSTRKDEIEKLKNTVEAMPDVRSEKVAALKQQISEGTYRVDGVKVAEKMLENFKGSDGSGVTK
jgi:negative regulator of flagellin synthesis FlgM